MNAAQKAAMRTRAAKAVATWPPLTSEQARRLVALLAKPPVATQAAARKAA